MVVETEMEQERLFDELKKGKQDQYVAYRKFIIEKQHRVMKKDEVNTFMQDFSVKFGDMDMAKNVMTAAYESADVIDGPKLTICKRCGWTVAFDRENRGICSDIRCRNYTNNFTDVEVVESPPIHYYRQRKGIVQFVGNPGVIELELENECRKLGLQTELWPDKDSYYSKITFHDGESWAVDAKDYSRAFLLKDKIEKDGKAIPQSHRWEAGFIVVPDERVRENRHYTRIVDQGIRQVGQRETVHCLKFTDFMEEVKKRVGGDSFEIGSKQII